MVQAPSQEVGSAILAQELMVATHDKPIDTDLGTTEEALESWRNHLCAFESRIWPIFQSYGYTRDTALLVWNLNTMQNGIEEKLAAIEEALLA